MSGNGNEHQTLWAELSAEYAARFDRSLVAHRRAEGVLIDGISHPARLFEPFPFYVSAAEGAHVTTIEGHRLVDFWQGHYANILGHNAPIVRDVLAQALARGHGLQVGLPEEAQCAYAELLTRATGAERARLTTAGTLATMYATMLARAFTGRRLVAKIAGGWHGANPLVLKGVDRNAVGYEHVDSAGVPEATAQEIALLRFNDVDGLRDLFARRGDELACLIMEPCLGTSGFVAATTEFMAEARRLTERHGALLILDEVITGFRFCAGGAQRLYGVQADLSTFGKVIGGGMPVSAVVGRADVLALAGRGARPRVWFNGGTFSDHPLALLAGKAMLEYLLAHEADIYPSLAEKGRRLREGIVRAFAAAGVEARVTGEGNEALRGGSLGAIYFPREGAPEPSSAEEWSDPAISDVALRERLLKVGLLLEGVHVVHGLGALSTAHDEAALQRVRDACEAFGRRVAAAR